MPTTTTTALSSIKMTIVQRISLPLYVMSTYFLKIFIDIVALFIGSSFVSESLPIYCILSKLHNISPCSGDHLTWTYC